MQAEPVDVPMEPKPQQEHHRPHNIKEVWGYIGNLLRPGYHLAKLKEDCKASIHALKNRDLEVLKGDKTSLAHAIRGRLLAAYFTVGPFGLLGPIGGAYFQYKIGQHLPFVSVSSFFVTVLLGNIFSIIGFQIIWGFSSKSLYRGKPPHFYNLISMYRDILPLQWRGFQRWAMANVVLMPLCTIMLSLIDKFLPVVAKNVPIGVLTPMLEILFVHTSLIRLMGDLFEKESHRIASNHVPN